MRVTFFVLATCTLFTHADATLTFDRDIEAPAVDEFDTEDNTTGPKYSQQIRIINIWSRASPVLGMLLRSIIVPEVIAHAVTLNADPATSSLVTPVLNVYGLLAAYSAVKMLNGNPMTIRSTLRQLLQITAVGSEGIVVLTALAAVAKGSISLASLRGIMVHTSVSLMASLVDAISNPFGLTDVAVRNSLVRLVQVAGNVALSATIMLMTGKMSSRYLSSPLVDILLGLGYTALWITWNSNDLIERDVVPPRKFRRF